MKGGEMPGKHVFLCYAREDGPAVDQLQAVLEAAGVQVWRDTARLWPGEDWRGSIRQAITGNALVFVACFSRDGLARARSYQHEELVLAVDEFRQRRPDVQWLIPVRLDECDIPDLALGGGRTLGQLQRADLFGKRREQETTRLVSAITRILRPPSEQDLTATPVSGDFGASGHLGTGAAAVQAASQGPASPVASTLPVDTAAFTGRGEQLEQIKAAAVAAADAGRVVAIHAIDGMPGVGKTTLAVHVGHLVAAQFPDRQLFVDLHAHTPGQRPAHPADVLAVLLAADGVDPHYLPGDLDGRAAMWRGRMAGKRVLLILDNAASSDQVAPLLPGAAGCLVLVTSRRYLGDLPSTLVPVPLDVLSQGEAEMMFISLAFRSGSERAKVTEMVILCGYLPLAISLLASMFNRHRTWTMEHLIGETEAKLLTVRAENRTVAAAFELSYQYLPDRQQRFFRHLGLSPGDDIDPYAAAALTGLPLEEAVGLLDELHSDRLLNEPVARRYQMHNLIHEYARALAAADDFADE